jgi:type IV secretion system protein VirD4
VTGALAIALVALGVAWLGPTLASRWAAPRRGRRGDGARWARARDLGPLGSRRRPSGRLVLGRCGRQLVTGDPAHSVLVVGPTQSGKTSGLAVPAILEWEGPVVAASVKADLARHTVAWRAEHGPTWVYDPSGVVEAEVVGCGAQPVRWTPVAAAATWPGARRVTASLVDAAREGAGPMADGDFWYASAAKLIAPLLHAAACGGGDVGDVIRWLDEQEEAEPTAALQAAGADAALQAVRACFGRDPRQRSGVYATAEAVLAAYVELGDQAVTGHGAGEMAVSGSRWFVPGAVVAGRGSLYLCAPAHHQRRLRPLFAALLGEVVQAAVDEAERRGRGLDPPLLVVVDEAANVAPIADLDVLAATAASHGIQLVTVWQDLAQVTSRYGSRAGTVVNNHRAKLFLSGIADPGTLEHASVLVGEVDDRLATTTVDHRGRRSSAEAPSRRRLLPPDALRRLAPGTGVLVAGHHQPVRLRLRPYFADRQLRQRAAWPPPGVQAAVSRAGSPAGRPVQCRCHVR